MEDDMRNMIYGYCNSTAQVTYNKVRLLISQGVKIPLGYYVLEEDDYFIDIITREYDKSPDNPYHIKLINLLLTSSYNVTERSDLRKYNSHKLLNDYASKLPVEKENPSIERSIKILDGFISKSLSMYKS